MGAAPRAGVLAPRRHASLPSPPGLALVLAGLLLAAAGPSVAAEDARLAELQASLIDDAWITSFRLEHAFGEKIEDQLRSGLPVTFRYQVEVYRKRGWLRSRLLLRKLEVTVEFDSLTRQYRLTRELDGEVVESSATEKEDEMRRWMTEVRDLRLGSVSGEAGEGPIVLRAKCRLSSGFMVFFFPVHQETGWERVRLSTLHARGKSDD